MTQLTLQCKDKRFPPGNWLLSLTEQGATLTDTEGTLRVWIPIKETGKCIYFPGWFQGSDLGVRLDAQVIVWFVPDPDSVAHITEFFHESWSAEGEGVLSNAF